MKRLPKFLLVSLFTFFVGIAAVSIWFFLTQNSAQNPKTEIIIAANKPIAELTIKAVEPEEDKFRNPLDEIWLEDKKFTYNGYTITKECIEIDSGYADCAIKIKINGRVLAKIELEDVRDNWIDYGFFNFLGDDDKQLIIHTYSGGAHCCYDYVIYDLKPTFRVIYDSTKFDSGNDVGNDLIPADIDGDGIFEFQQDVMAFGYFHASYAGSVFPPVIFAYDKKKGHYDFANKKFPDFVMNELEENLDWVKKQGLDPVGDYTVTKTFLNLVYAGKEKQAWKFFDENYDFEDKEDFRKDVKKVFSQDITYKSIYRR